MTQPLTFYQARPDDIFRTNGKICLQVLGKRVDVEYKAGESIREVTERIAAMLQQLHNSSDTKKE